MGLLSGIVGAFRGSKTARKNVEAANRYAEQVKWQPTGMNLPGMNVGWDGQNVTGALSPELQALQSSLFGGAGGFLGGLGGSGIPPELQAEFARFNSSIPGMPSGSLAGVNPSLNGIPGAVGVNPALPNYGGLLGGLINDTGALASNMYGGAINPMQLSTTMGDQLNAQGSGFLGALGSFDPRAAAGQYTNTLRQGALPREQRAVQSVVDDLFKTGRLGTTGGSQLLGDVSRGLEEADVSRQIAGMDYAGAEQSRLAGLGQSLGQAGTGINAGYAGLNDSLRTGALGRYGSAFGMAQGADQMGFDRAIGLNEMGFQRGMGIDETNYARALTGNEMGFNRAMGLNQAGFDRGMNLAAMGHERANSRFLNAMNLFGAGQQAQQQQFGMGMGMLQGGQSIDDEMLNAIMMSGNLSTMRSGVQQQAYQPLLGAEVARNNVAGNKWSGILGGLDTMFGGQIGNALGGWLGGLGGGADTGVGGANAPIPPWVKRGY